MNLNAIKRHPAVYKALLAARSAAGRMWMRLCHRTHGVAPNRVFFSSFKGKSYSDSPRFISEALHAICPEAELVWQLSDGRGAPDYVRTVKPHTLAALRELACARCIVDNFNRPQYLLKFPDQLYVQTWHGDRGFKKVLFDMDPNARYPDGAQMDLAVSGSDFATRLYRTAFRYSGEVLQAGMPRNDALLSPDPARIAEVRRRLNVPDGARVLLCAPTFRDATAGHVQSAGFDLRRALDALERATDEPWRCFVRAHDKNRGVDCADDARIADVTTYPEMSDLLLIADLLITDYSSSAGDFALLNRPIILFQPDLERFTDSDRQMYFDLRTCPYTRAESEDELYALLEQFCELPSDGLPALAFYGATETGRSAEAVARWIANRLR